MNTFGTRTLLAFSMCGLVFAFTSVHGLRLAAQDDTSVESSGSEGDADELEPLTEEAAKAADELGARLAADSEAGIMLAAILKGSQLGPNDGWFTVSKTQSRYDWEWVATQFDKDANAQVTPEEFGGEERDFAVLDRNLDGVLTESDIAWPSEQPGNEFYGLVGGLDLDDNGKLDMQELTGLAGILGATGRDSITTEELRQLLGPPSSPTPYKGEDSPSRSTLVMGLAQQEIGALEAGPGLGDLAPDFTLATLDGEEVTLSHVGREKPVCLIFGNFTCGPFRSQAGNLERIYRRFNDRVNFYVVYVREAHPSDGWWMEMNDRIGINIKQPKDMDERRTVASFCQEHLNFDVTMLVDTIDDSVGGQYSGMPSRLYLLDRNLTVAFKSGRGPFGFKPAELETAIALNLNAGGEEE